eukprot:jgi/Orpsp1_1/1178202/evm.model.c7180000064405.1
MNFTFITKSFSFIGWFNVLFNDESNNYNYGDCEKIINILNTENIYCMENSDGKVTELSISPSCSIERHINDLLSYNTIEELVFRSYDDDDEQCSRFKYFPNKIGNLNNLKVLTLNGIKTITKNDILNIPVSVKELSFGNSKLTQENIDSLERLSNLEKLYFDHTVIKDELDFKSIENLEKLKELNINYSNIYRHNDYSPIYYLKHFKNIEELYIAGGILTKEDLEEIGQLKNLKSLRIYESKYEGDDDIQNIIKNFKKLSLV